RGELRRWRCAGTLRAGVAKEERWKTQLRPGAPWVWAVPQGALDAFVVPGGLRRGGAGVVVWAGGGLGGAPGATSGAVCGAAGGPGAAGLGGGLGGRVRVRCRRGVVTTCAVSDVAVCAAVGVGPVGPTGPTGPTGPEGPSGATGEQGLQGLPGVP